MEGGRDKQRGNPKTQVQKPNLGHPPLLPVLRKRGSGPLIGPVRERNREAIFGPAVVARPSTCFSGNGVCQDLLGSSHSGAAPVPHIVGIERNAEEIRGYESKLRGS